MLAACVVLLAFPAHSFAQQSAGSLDNSAGVQLPEAPQPQIAMADDPAIGYTIEQAPAAPAAPAPAQGSSSSQSGMQQPEAEKSQHEKAEEQIKEQEKQRVVGVLPQFNISYHADAVSMTESQKLRLAFRSAVDPVAFGVAVVAAGYREALDDDPGFGWGPEGFGKRAGAVYLDAFDGAIIGNGILPALLHQDPRYFRLGHGTVSHRLLYSLSTNVICKHDNSHRWEPNISNVGGNIISGAISNLYYPASNSGFGQTITNGLTVTAEGGLGSIFDEFWPDVERKLFHRDPTHGLDAQLRAQDEAAKEAKKQQKPQQ